MLFKGFEVRFMNKKFGVQGYRTNGLCCRIYVLFSGVAVFELVIATIGTIVTCTWIGLGVLIQKFYLRHFRVINIILALTLLECIWGMLR